MDTLIYFFLTYFYTSNFLHCSQEESRWCLLGDQELTVAQTMNSLLPNSDLN